MCQQWARVPLDTKDWKIRASLLVLVARQGEGSEPAESRRRVCGASLSYHGVGAQPSVSRAHLLYLRHQGLEQGVGGGRGGAGRGHVFVGGRAPHVLLAALRGYRPGMALWRGKKDEVTAPSRLARQPRTFVPPLPTWWGSGTGCPLTPAPWLPCDMGETQ